MHHQLCMGCIKGGLMECPCGSTVLVEHINTPSPLTLKLIGSLLIHCNNKDCKEVMELKHLMAHISSSCQHTTVPPPPTITVSQHTMGLIAETVVPGSGHITCRSPTGKVRVNNVSKVCSRSLCIRENCSNA